MLVLLLVILAALALVALGAYLFRRLERGVEDEAPDGPSTGHAGGMLSALFLLALAIAVVVPWTTADTARENSYAESDTIVRAYWAAGDLPAPAATEVREGLTGYVEFIVDDEWSEMAAGDLDPKSAELLANLHDEVAAIPDDSPATVDAKSAVQAEIQELFTARRTRAADASATPPTVILWLTVLSGLAVLLFPFLAGARPRGAALVPMALMAVMLGVAIFFILDVRHAFDGSLRVGPDAFRAALAEFRQISGR